MYDGLVFLGVIYFGYRRGDGEAKQYRQAEEYHGVQSDPNCVHDCEKGWVYGRGRSGAGERRGLYGVSKMAPRGTALEKNADCTVHPSDEGNK